MKIRHRIRKMSNRSGWLYNFTSCMVGTVLGIALTFGVDDYVETLKQRETTRRIIEHAISSLEDSQVTFDESLELFRSKDSVFQNVFTYFPDRASEVHSDTIIKVLMSLWEYEFAVIDYTSENIFMNSMDTWTNKETFELVNLIGDCYVLVDEMLLHCRKTRLLKEKFCESFTNGMRFGFDPHKIIENLFKTEGFFYFVLQYNTFTDHLEMMIGVLDEQMEKIKEAAALI